MNRISRRVLLRLSALAGASTVVAACAPAQVIKETVVVEKAVKETVVVEKAVKETVVVEVAKEKEVTKVIEKVITSAPGPAKAVKLTYYIGFGAGGAPEQVDAVKKIFSRFTAAHPNVTVEPLVVPGGQAVNKFKAMVAASTPPDVLTMGMAGMDMAVRGAFADIRPHLEADKVDESQWDKAALASYTVVKNSVLYGLPHGLNTMFLIANKTLWDKAGLTLPKGYDDANWTWDAALEAAKKLTVGSGKNIEQFGMMGVLNNRMACWMFGSAFSTDDLTKLTFDSPESIKAFEYIQDAIYKHRVAPSDAEKQGLPQGFLSGKIGMYYDGNWAINNLLTVKDFEVEWVPVAYGAPLTVDKGRGSPYWPDALAIASRLYANESWDLVKFTLLDDNNYKEFMQLMSMIPARKALRSWYYDEVWIGKYPNKNWKVVQDMFGYARVDTLLLNPNWPEPNNIFEAGLTSIMANDAKPAQILPELAKKCDPAWQQGLAMAW